MGIDESVRTVRELSWINRLDEGVVMNVRDGVVWYRVSFKRSSPTRTGIIHPIIHPSLLFSSLAPGASLLADPK